MSVGYVGVNVLTDVVWLMDVDVDVGAVIAFKV